MIDISIFCICIALPARQPLSSRLFGDEPALRPRRRVPDVAPSSPLVSVEPGPRLVRRRLYVDGVPSRPRRSPCDAPPQWVRRVRVRDDDAAPPRLVRRFVEEVPSRAQRRAGTSPVIAQFFGAVAVGGLPEGHHPLRTVPVRGFEEKQHPLRRPGSVLLTSVRNLRDNIKPRG